MNKLQQLQYVQLLKQVIIGELFVSRFFLSSSSFSFRYMFEVNTTRLGFFFKKEKTPRHCDIGGE